MKYRFEQIDHFIAWYLRPKCPLLIPKDDFSSICDDIDFGSDQDSSIFRMAVFQGIGNKDDRFSAQSEKVTEAIWKRMELSEWPYTYSFHGLQAQNSVSAYLAAFFFCNRKFSATSRTTTIDHSTYFEIERNRIIRKEIIFSFSASSISRIVGSSFRFFVIIQNNKLLFFGGGKPRRFHTGLNKNELDTMNYADLASESGV